MKKIFYIMGKSSSGKDTIYQRLMAIPQLKLDKVIPYTTRPMREGEREGREYHFCDEQRADELARAGKIIELREYHTVFGIWKYFTVFDDQFCREDKSGAFLMIGTLEGFVNVRRFFGKESVYPIYIEVEDGERLMRAISREKEQEKPAYQEMCRRFLADAEDFSEDKLKEADIEERFINNDLDRTVEEIRDYIFDKVGRKIDGSSKGK